jgi:hypothetical protein
MLDGDESALLHSFAHIVWSDENFDSASWCLARRSAYENEDYTEDEHNIVEWSLHQLLKLPQPALVPPEDYDGEHPENYPIPEIWFQSFQELTGEGL